MKGLLKILIAVFAVCLIAPAFSAVENVKVGGDIAVWGVLRGDWGDDGTNLHAFLTQARVYVSADLSQNVSTMIRLINERTWGTPENDIGNDVYNRADIQIDLAYLKIKDALTPGLTFTIGRQEIELGEGLVVGNRYWAEPYYPADGIWPVTDLGLQKAFDAIRVDYAPEAVPVNITAFYSKINEQFSNNNADIYESNLYGVDIGFKLADVANIDLYYVGLGAIPLTWNPYWGYNEDDGMLHTAGVRIVSGIPGVTGLTLKAEYAKQFGNSGTTYDIDFRGWALLAGIKYEMQTNMNPYIKLNYARYSADDDTTSDIWENWLPVFPSNIASRIGPLFYAYDAWYTENSLVGGGNAQAINFGFGFSPTEKWNVCLDGYWLDQIVDTYGTFGYEVDLGVEYKYTEDLTLGVTGGMIFGGDVFGGGLGRPWQVLGYAKLAF